MSQETLLSQSMIWLYGRVMADLTLNKSAAAGGPYYAPKDDADADATDTPLRGGKANDFLYKQIIQKDSCLARIVGFAYEGRYYEMARPAIFLVHGAGLAPEFDANPHQKDQPPTMPQETGRTGLADPGLGTFAYGIRIWAYDSADFTIRLDMDSGTFESVLLDAELSGMGTGQSAGAQLRSSGAQLRSAGAQLRSAGAQLRGGRGNSD